MKDDRLYLRGYPEIKIWLDPLCLCAFVVYSNAIGVKPQRHKGTKTVLSLTFGITSDSKRFLRVYQNPKIKAKSTLERT